MTIKLAVKAIWHDFSAPLEGRVHHMYLDVKGLVTTGVGNLIDSVAAAIKLPWRHADGRLATAGEVAAAWEILKLRQDLARRHFSEAGKLNDLRLSDQAIDDLVGFRLLANAEDLAEQFAEWERWPADAQLAALSNAWAVGSRWPQKFPICSQLLRSGSFAAAGIAMGDGSSGVAADPSVPSGLKVRGSAPCDIRTTGNPGVIPRNALNRCHFIAAGSELAQAYPDVLHGPCTLAALKAGWQPAGELTYEDPGFKLPTT